MKNIVVIALSLVLFNCASPHAPKLITPDTTVDYASWAKQNQASDIIKLSTEHTDQLSSNIFLLNKC